MTIRELDLLITDKCNLRCNYCYTNGNIKGDMTLDCVRNVADRVNDSNVELHISGGEPLLHPQFRTIIGVLSETNIPIQIQTNGIFLDEALLDLMILKFANRFSIMLSIDVLKAPKGGNNTKSIDAYITKVRQILYRGIFLRVNSVVKKSNYPIILDLLKELYKQGINMHTLSRFTPMGAGANQKDQYINDKEWIQLCTNLKELVVKRCNRKNYKALIQQGLIESGDDKNFEYWYCPAKRGEIATMLPNGSIVACPLMLGRRNLAEKKHMMFSSLDDAISHSAQIQEKGSRFNCAIRDPSLGFFPSQVNENITHMEMKYCCVLEKFDIKFGYPFRGKCINA